MTDETTAPLQLRGLLLWAALRSKRTDQKAAAVLAIRKALETERTIDGAAVVLDVNRSTLSAHLSTYPELRTGIALRGPGRRAGS